MEWIGINAAAIATIVSILALLVPLYQYVNTRRSEDRKHTFEAYHKLIGDLVDPPTPRLDRQIAVVYELRNFKDYYPVSLRILEGLKGDWSSNAKPRIQKEIDLTIDHINRHLGLLR